MTLPVGKLPVEILDRLLKTYTSSINGVAVGASIGVDAAAIDLGDRYLLAKTDPITFVADDIGTYAIFVNANDIAAMGGRPRWFLATVLLPEGRTTADLAEEIFRQIAAACRRVDAAFCGGHTEITAGIDRPIVVGAMLGEVAKDRLVTAAGAKPGDHILLSKPIAIEGTSILARDRAADLSAAFGEDFVARCRRLAEDPGIGVLADARIAMEAGGIHAMHDPTEGGLANALHEVAAAAGVGLTVDEERIPILDECRAVCERLGLDPLGLIASGSLLVMADPADGERVLSALRGAGLSAARIGTIAPKDAGVKIKKGGRTEDLPRFERDEITRVL